MTVYVVKNVGDEAVVAVFDSEDAACRFVHESNADNKTNRLTCYVSGDFEVRSA